MSNGISRLEECTTYKWANGIELGKIGLIMVLVEQTLPPEDQ